MDISNGFACFEVQPDGFARLILSRDDSKVLLERLLYMIRQSAWRVSFSDQDNSKKNSLDIYRISRMVFEMISNTNNHIIISNISLEEIDIIKSSIRSFSRIETEYMFMRKAIENASDFIDTIRSAGPMGPAEADNVIKSVPCIMES